jgi:hypothetical protein
MFKEEDSARFEKELDEYQEIERLCQAAARQVWIEQPKLSFDEVIDRVEIKEFVLKGKRYEKTQLYAWIAPSPGAIEEFRFYRKLSVWRIEDAVALWLNINPFILLQASRSDKSENWHRFIMPHLRSKYYETLQLLKSDEIVGKIKTEIDKLEHFVTPEIFYEWAVQRTDGPRGEQPAEFFDDLKKEWDVIKVDENNIVAETPLQTVVAKPHGHLNHDPEMQQRANEIAAELIEQKKKSPTKNTVAKKLAAELGMTVDTVLRRIRAEWKK